MGTRTIVFCDECSKERTDGSETWLTGVLGTDGGSNPAYQSSGLFCSKECTLKAIDKFMAKVYPEEPVP